LILKIQPNMLVSSKRSMTSFMVVLGRAWGWMCWHKRMRTQGVEIEFLNYSFMRKGYWYHFDNFAGYVGFVVRLFLCQLIRLSSW